jgi:hypothetical protein
VPVRPESRLTPPAWLGDRPRGGTGPGRSLPGNASLGVTCRSNASATASPAAAPARAGAEAPDAGAVAWAAARPSGRARASILAGFGRECAPIWQLLANIGPTGSPVPALTGPPSASARREMCGCGACGCGVCGCGACGCGACGCWGLPAGWPSARPARGPILSQPPRPGKVRLERRFGWCETLRSALKGYSSLAGRADHDDGGAGSLTATSRILIA